MTEDVSIHIIQSHRPRGLLQRGIDPNTIIPLPQLIPHNPMRHPVVEAPHYPSNVMVHNPGLFAKEQYGLQYGRIK